QYSRRGLLYGFSRGSGGDNVAVNIPGFAFFGREPFSFVKRTEQRYQLTDNFSWAVGTHSIKFGVDGNYVPLSADFTVNFGGIYNFGDVSASSFGFSNFPGLSPVQAYGAGIPANFIQGVGNPHDAFSNTPLGTFVQDSWRIRPSLTLNYGVRYDVELTPQFGPLNALAKQGQDFLPNASCTPPGLSQALNYLPSQQRFNPAPNAPSAFVNQAYLQAGVPLAIQPFGFPNAKNFQYAYSNQANLTFERELGRDLSLSVEYNFNGGRHLNRPINVNAVKPAALLANWRASLSDPLSGAATLGPLGVGSSVPCDPL